MAYKYPGKAYLFNQHQRYFSSIKFTLFDIIFLVLGRIHRSCGTRDCRPMLAVSPLSPLRNCANGVGVTCNCYLSNIVDLSLTSFLWQNYAWVFVCPFFIHFQWMIEWTLQGLWKGGSSSPNYSDICLPRNIPSECVIHVWLTDNQTDGRTWTVRQNASTVLWTNANDNIFEV